MYLTVIKLFSCFMTIHDNIMNKISFQVPYNNNNNFTQNVLFFQELLSLIYIYYRFIENC